MRILDELKAAFGSVAEARQAALSGKASDLEKVIAFLLKDEEWQRQFFIEAAGKSVFNREKFLELLDNRELDKSYTKFSNKIGLGLKGKSRFLKAQATVVLNFPYKDCVLKGAQGKDDAKSKELFFNEILAAAEIDALFRPKVLCNFELIQSDGAEGVNLLDELRSEDVNLLIKGNNLLALHTLKRRRDIYGKVKLIYIDPPYNTGNDSFRYNDRFGHSTWLAFMKSRLEVAREFLRDDGVIFIQCDDNEQAYLKVLCDEIFGMDKFIACCPVVVNRGGRDYGGIAKTHDYLLCYQKDFYELLQVEDENKTFQYEDENGGFNLMELRNRNVRFNKENRPNLYYPFYINPNNEDENNLLEISLTPKKDFIELYPLESQGISTVWRWSREKSEKFLNTEIKGKRKQNGGFMVVQKNRLSAKRQRSVWDDIDFVNERGTEHIKSMMGKDSFGYPKSEFLLKRIIEISTNEGDIAMDFFAGSGTTLAVAHKMNRRWVGVEQMGYIETITKERLKKVVAGEQGGVSKATGWQGGGGFVYAELAPLNASFKEKIAAASAEELEGIYAELEEKAFLDYRVDFCEMLQDGDFAALPLDEKKQALLDALDSNMDYVLLSDLDDEGFSLDDETRKRNRTFFGDSELRT